jgi:hypothetical protein
VRSAMVETDQALGALAVAQQVSWSSDAADLYRAALADAARAVHAARAAAESAAASVSAVDGR